MRDELTTTPSRWIFALAACASLLCASLVAAPSPAAAEGVEWGGEGDKVKKGDLGPFIGARLNYELRTQFATLYSSHTRLKLMWRDAWADEDVEQVLFEGERAARLEDYELELIRGKATVTVGYLCPKDRKDTTTRCTERWEWQKNTRRFVLRETTSSDPLAKSFEHIEELIEEGKVKKAREELARAREELGDDKLDHDRLFGLFWAHAIEQAYPLRKSNTKKAAKIIGEFIEEPPITASERCPGEDFIKVCMGDKARAECGCSDDFGHVPYSERWDRRYRNLARTLGEIEDHAMTISLLSPATGMFPENTDVMLALADAYWATDRKYKAYPLYAKVRKIRMAQKVYIPNRVYERYEAK